MGLREEAPPGSTMHTGWAPSTVSWPATPQLGNRMLPKREGNSRSNKMRCLGKTKKRVEQGSEEARRDDPISKKESGRGQRGRMDDRDARASIKAARHKGRVPLDLRLWA